MMLRRLFLWLASPPVTWFACATQWRCSEAGLKGAPGACLASKCASATDSIASGRFGGRHQSSHEPVAVRGHVGTLDGGGDAKRRGYAGRDPLSYVVEWIASQARNLRPAINPEHRPVPRQSWLPTHTAPCPAPRHPGEPPCNVNASQHVKGRPSPPPPRSGPSPPARGSRARVPLPPPPPAPRASPAPRFATTPHPCLRRRPAGGRRVSRARRRWRHRCLVPGTPTPAPVVIRDDGKQYAAGQTPAASHARSGADAVAWRRRVAVGASSPPCVADSRGPCRDVVRRLARPRRLGCVRVIESELNC